MSASEASGWTSGPVNVSPEGKETLPPKDQVYGSIEGLIHHFELIMTNRGFEAPKGEVYGCIDADPAKARSDGIGTQAIGQSTFERFMSVEQLAEVSLIGSPEEIRRRVTAYSEAGVSHFEIKFIYPNLERHSQMLQLFAREVLAAFR